MATRSASDKANLPQTSPDESSPLEPFFTLQAEQGISGIGVFLFGLGMSDLLFQKLINNVETVSGFPIVSIPVLSSIPVIGEIFFNHNILVYGAYLLVPVAWFIFKTIPTSGV